MYRYSSLTSYTQILEFITVFPFSAPEEGYQQSGGGAELMTGQKVARTGDIGRDARRLRYQGDSITSDGFNVLR